MKWHCHAQNLVFGFMLTQFVWSDAQIFVLGSVLPRGFVGFKWHGHVQIWVLVLSPIFL